MKFVQLINANEIKESIKLKIYINVCTCTINKAYRNCETDI